MAISSGATARRRSSKLAPVCVAAALIVLACSSAHSHGPSRHGPRGDSGAADASVAPSSPIDGGTGTAPILRLDAGTHRPAGDGASSTCSAEVRQAEQLELDMIVAMDGSRSMNDEVSGGRKWDLVVNALRAFADDPRSAGIGIGLTYFGIPAGYDAGDLVVSCNATDYATPAVPISDLPGNARLLEASLSSFEPIGGTPTLPALTGVMAYAHTWLSAHPTHRVVVVLATDGEPNDCDSSVDAVAMVADGAAAGHPPVSTYVIGVGSSLSNLGQIATAGGTDHAFLVDTAAGTTADFAAAMNAIRGEAALPCSYELPSPAPGSSLDYGKVNVERGSGTDGGKSTLPQVQDEAECGTTDGWHYDDPGRPASIELCPATCASVERDPTAIVQVLVGCETEVRGVR